MIFSSITFLFYFLPAVLAMYYLVPARLKNGVLFGASLLFYAWGEPVYVGLLIFSSLVDFVLGMLAEKYRRTKKARIALAASVLVNVGLLAVFKYSRKLPLPIGISFYTFQTMSYTIDVYRGEVKAQRNWVDFGAYVSMFPQLIAGPIVRYAEIEQEMRNRRVTWDQAALGIRRFVLGLGKKVLLANPMGELWQSLSGSAGPGSTVGAWLGLTAFALQIYFDFSGYSDMAIGLGHLFGFHYPENFDHPYLAKSVTEFWRRWHKTLGQWFRDYVYIPLGGNRCSRLKWCRNLLIVWGLTGLWHGAGWNFLFWGLYFGVLLMAEKMFLETHRKRWPSWLQHGYALFVILIGWAIFAWDEIGCGGSYYLALCGLRVPVWSGTAGYYLRSYLGVWLLGIIGATNLPRRLAEKGAAVLEKRPGLQAFLEVGFLAAVFVLAVADLVRGTYNPFLYFRF